METFKIFNGGIYTMADIEYRCIKCDAIRVVSEFADASKLKCAACGEGLRKASDPPPVVTRRGDPDPVEITPAAGASRLKVAKLQREQIDAEVFQPVKSAPVQEQPEKRSVADELLRQPLELHPKVKRKKKSLNHLLYSALLFLVLAAGTGYLRYGIEMQLPGSAALNADLIKEALKFAGWGIVLLNLVVVIRAMSDNMFQGLLCLLIPGYSVYYLLLVSDNFYLRAAIFGCLIGIAQDGGMQIHGVAVRWMNEIGRAHV